MIQADKSLFNGYKFIDLFAGIGGFHLALNSFGAECVFASEWDKEATQTYSENFSSVPEGDITLIDEKDIPQHDIICGGFPCQAFSVAGNQKGFDDTRGTLFFDIARIINYHRPKIVFLENVKNIEKHNDGKTIEIILNTLDELGYVVFHKVLNSSNYGLPQNRERIYFVGYRKDLGVKKFSFPKPPNTIVSIKDILENEPTNVKFIDRPDINIYKTFSNLFDLTYNRPLQIGKVNKGGQGERIYDVNGHGITLSAYGGGIGAKTGLFLINDKIRKLTPRECARVQGFPDTFIINKKINQAYKQFGNSVSVNVLQYILKEIHKYL
ncbi:MAG: DNA cytosine methyltransferase [Bacteroidales bacterium]